MGIQQDVVQKDSLFPAYPEPVRDSRTNLEEPDWRPWHRPGPH